MGQGDLVHSFGYLDAANEAESNDTSPSNITEFWK